MYQVFSQHAWFCSITQSRGKKSDAGRKQTSRAIICEMRAKRDKAGDGLMEGNKEMQAEIKPTSLKEASL